MDKFEIDGPCGIKGKVNISGSKNASLPILAATLLFDQQVIIKNLLTLLPQKRKDFILVMQVIGLRILSLLKNLKLF